jgi:rhodanese-related sulfurtransferase
MQLSHPVPSVTPREVVAEAAADPESITLLDVRSDEERAFTSIEGIHIPLQELPNRLDELREYSDRKLVVYCRSGHRSASVVAWLRSRGFANVLNLEGGLRAWHRDVDPSVRVY